MALNTTFVTGAVYTAAQANNFPFGVVDYKSGTTAQTGINTATDITGLSITWTAIAGRVYMAQFNLNPYGSAGDSSNQLIVLDGTAVWQNRRNFTTLNVIDSSPGQYFFTTTSASHTIKIQMSKAGTNNVNNYADTATFECNFALFDLGAR
jgi:hypothetical protein